MYLVTIKIEEYEECILPRVTTIASAVVHSILETLRSSTADVASADVAGLYGMMGVWCTHACCLQMYFHETTIIKQNLR